MISGVCSSRIKKEIKQHSEQIALASNYLNCKVIYISIIEALSIVRNYADAKLKKIMKKQNFSTALDKDDASRLSNTELVRMINSNTKLKGRKGQTGSKSKEAFDKLLSFAENNDTILNRTFGEALEINGYIDQYETEQDFGIGLTRRTDLLCKKMKIYALNLCGERKHPKRKFLIMCSQNYIIIARR